MARLWLTMTKLQMITPFNHKRVWFSLEKKGGRESEVDGWGSITNIFGIHPYAHKIPSKKEYHIYLHNIHMYKNTILLIVILRTIDKGNFI